MELRDYLKIIQKRAVLLLIITILVAIFSYFFAKNQKPRFEGLISVSVQKLPEEAGRADFYQYDRFYNLQAASFYIDDIIGRLKAPNVVLEAFKKANTSPESSDSRYLSTFFRTTKQPQSGVLAISFKSKNKERVEKIAQSLPQVLEEKNDPVFKVTYSNPEIITHLANVTNTTAVGLVVGLILGLIVVFLTEYVIKEG